MRIGLFIPTLDGGGAEQVMLILAKGFSKRGHHVDLVLARATGPYLNRIPPSVNLVDLKASHPLTAVPVLAKYLRRTRPAAMFSSLNHANLALLWAVRLARRPVWCVVREANTLSFDLAVSRNISARLMPWLIRKCYPWANVTVALSEGVANDLAMTTGLVRDRIQVVYNPVDFATIKRLAREPAPHLWFLRNGPPVVLGIGRLCTQKDFSTLIRAFSYVCKVCESRLIILGQGEERPKLETLVRALGLKERADFPGFVDNPYAYLARSAVFVLSSRWEGLGNVLIEALACGVPIVATDCPYGPGEVLEAGRFGSLVPVRDPEAMGQAILQVLHGNVPQFDRSTALARFDETQVTDRFLDLLIPKEFAER